VKPHAAVALADYRRSVAQLYATVRVAPSGKDGHGLWTAGRDRLFAHHPQSAIAVAQRPGFPGLAYWPYDPDFRVVGELVDAPPLALNIPHSAGGSTPFDRIGRLRFDLMGESCALDLFWLDAYGGGLFLPFRDATNGIETYGGGRFLLDTVKGADLGTVEGELILDFNFAYHPSCVYSPRWSCPLAPPGNLLKLRVPAGERLTSKS